MNNSSIRRASRRSTRVRRCVGVLSALTLGLAWALIPTGPAQAASGPYLIDGTIPDNNAFFEADDPEGNVKELGPLNSNTTKIGVIHNDALPTLGLTNPNANVDLRRAWLDTGKDPSTGHDWLYFAWERDSNNGSGFIAYEFMHNAAPDGCDYGAGSATLIANCNPWANRTAGDFIILWDQQGNSTDLYLRTWSGTAPNLTLGAPTLLDDTVSDAAYGSNNFRGEAAVDLTATIFNGTDCVSFANTIPSTVTGNSDTADYKDTILKQIPPITNCGTVIIRKVTDPSPDLVSSFDYTTTGGLDPSTFSLKDGEAQDYGATVHAGSYSVTESGLAANFELSGLDCSASDAGNGSVITPDLGTATVSFDLEAGDTVDCTYTNKLNTGAILVSKTRKHAADGPGDHPQSGVDFTVNGVTHSTGANGEACFDGLPFGTYSVHETLPAGYHGEADKVVTVDNSATCADATYVGETVDFHNTPLTDITVSVDSQVDGGTASTIDCVVASGSTGANGDGSLTASDLEPGTYTCTIVVDP
jgi:prealbumin domain-containing protein